MYWCESDDERWGRANPLIPDGGNVRARNLAPLAADRWLLFLYRCTPEQMLHPNRRRHSTEFQCRQCGKRTYLSPISRSKHAPNFPKNPIRFGGATRVEPLE